MVKHLVMFKLKEKNAETLEKAVSAIRAMEGKIESLRFLEVGLDFKGSPRSFDFVLVSHFDDRAGLDAYAVHPVHQPVLKLMGELCSHITAVDYEL